MTSRRQIHLIWQKQNYTASLFSLSFFTGLLCKYKSFWLKLGHWACKCVYIHDARPPSRLQSSTNLTSASYSSAWILYVHTQIKIIFTHSILCMRNAFPVVLCVWTPASVQHCMFDCCYRLCYASFCMIVVLLFAWVSRFSAPIFSVFTQTSADSISSGHCCLQVCFVTVMTNESKIIEIIICACGLQILYYFVNIYTF